VSEEIAQAIKEIDNPRLKRSEAIHEVRKHCKKIRSVLRLVRPQFEETYQFENAWFRDTAKGIAELRDAEAIIETYDSLLDKFSDQVDRRAFAPVRRALTLRRKKIIEETGDLNQRLKKIRARMDEAAGRVADWKLKVDGFDGIGGGARRDISSGAQDHGRGLRRPNRGEFSRMAKAGQVSRLSYEIVARVVETGHALA